MQDKPKANKEQSTETEKAQLLSRSKQASAFLSRSDIKAYTMVVFSLFALAFFAFFAIKPTLTSYFMLRRQISDAQKHDIQLTLKIRSLLKAQTEYYRIQNDLDLLDDALPEEANFPALVKTIEQITTDEGETVIAFNSREVTLLEENTTKHNKGTKKTNDPLSVGFTLELQANYQNHEQVLSRLLNLRRIVLLDRMELSHTPSRQATIDTVTMEVSGNAYHKGQ